MTLRFGSMAAIAALLLCVSTATAAPEPQSTPPESDAAADARVLDKVVVTGVVPGPGLWRLSKGNSEAILTVVDGHPGAEIRYTYTPR